MSETLSAGTVSVAVKPDTKGFGLGVKSGVLSGAGGVGKDLGGLIMGGLKTMAGPIAAVTAAFSIKHVLEDSMHAFEDLAGQVRGMQRITGGTVEQVSELRGAMQLAGVDTGNITGAITRFSSNLGKAGADAKKTAEMNDLFGQSIKDASGAIKPMAELLPGLADKFKAMPDGANKTALATQLFGRAGTQMIPVLNKGSEGIQELTDKAKKMGLTLNDASMEGFLESKKSARDFNAAIQGLKVTMGSELVPVVDAVQNIFRNALAPVILSVTGFLNSHREAFSKLAEGITAFGKNATSNLGAFFKSVGSAFSALGPVFSQLIPQLVQLSSAFSPVSLIFKSLAPVLPQIVNLIVQLAISVGGTLAEALGQILPVIVELSRMLVAQLSGIVQELLPVIIMLASTFAGTLGQVIKLLVPVVVELVKAVLSLLPSIMPLIPSVLLLVKALASLIPPLAQLLLALLPPIIDLFNLLLPIVTGLAQVLVKVLVWALQLVISVLSNVIKWVGGVIGFFGDLMKSATDLGHTIGDVFGAIGSAIQGAFNGSVNTVRAAINGIINLVNHAIDGINGLASGVKDLTGGAINLSLPHIPKLAEGGIVTPTAGGRLVRVAEAGEAEAVIPLSKLNQVGGGGSPTIHYYAARNDSITAEQKLVAAIQKARVIAWT